MARTITEIFDSIKTNYVAERAAAGLPADDPALWSKVNIKRLIFYVVAFAAYVQEQIFDRQREETNNDLATKRPASIYWYRDQILAYQHGFPLLPDSDQYDNTGYTDTQIEASKVVKYCVVQRQVDDSGYVLFIRIKMAGENGDEPDKLAADIVTGVKAYLERFVAAGDNVEVISLDADLLKMKWQIYYNPAILKADGSRQDGTASAPITDAIKGYLKSGDFKSGKYSITSHIDAVQQVQGVITPKVLACSASYDSLPYIDINEYYQPHAGWLRFSDIDTDLEIEMISE